MSSPMSEFWKTVRVVFKSKWFMVVIVLLAVNHVVGGVTVADIALLADKAIAAIMASMPG